MALDKHTIIKYRLAAESVGLWDENYSKIKKDIPTILADIRSRDYALDILGASIKQMELMARLVVYGYSSNDLSDEDLTTLMTPLESMSELEHSPDMMSGGASKAVENIMPALFGVMQSASSLDEMEKIMRRLMAEPAKLSTVGLMHGLGISICLRKYPGAYHEIHALNAFLSKITASAPVKPDIDGAVKTRAHPGTQNYEVSTFAALFAVALVECNLKGEERAYNDMYELMRRIDDVAKRHNMYDYLHSPEFKLLIHGVEEFHDIG